VEARGFIFDSSIALAIGAKFVPIRKPNKLPGTISQNEMQSKQKDLEPEANALISMGGKVFVDILPYDEAPKLCGGWLLIMFPRSVYKRYNLIAYCK
ncbi:Adenine phosphoribosyltransferase 1, partial [Glycine soja]